ncbi:3-hydroxybutyrate dehydrogenase [Citricoccus sp. GCM10030269]|uniref:3-hydroxybutyrate dehydrogenase n=1 Tax=Citricoccus sp. GCM10030269 TaxID=3273388 RepID=UPI00360A930C
MTADVTEDPKPAGGAAVFRDGILAGRRAVVTGGASGIGAACVRALAEAGAEVTVADLDADAAESLAAEVGGQAWVADLSDTESLDGLTLDTDILVNNAGIQRVVPIHEFDPAAWRFIHRLMLESPFLLIRAALPGMYERGFGRIINLSSAHGVRASAFKSAYVAAKHGLEGLSKVTALEGAEHGVTSNCVDPSYVRTPLVEKQIADQAATHGISEDEVVEKIMLTESAVKRLVEPEEVASLVLWLASDASGMATGAAYALDGGWTAS